MAKKITVRKPSRRRKAPAKPRLMKVPSRLIESPKSTPSSRKKIVMVVLAVFILGALIYNFKHLFVVALVNQTPIFRFTFDRQLEKQIGKDFLENEISRHLVLQEAVRQKIAILPTEVDERVKGIEKQITGRGAKLEDLLSMQGQTLETLKNQLQIQLLIEKILGQDVNVSDEEVKNYFDQNKTAYPNQTIDQVKGDIQKQLFQQKLSEKVTPWLKDLRAKANIQYFLQF